MSRPCHCHSLTLCYPGMHFESVDAFSRATKLLAKVVFYCSVVQAGNGSKFSIPSDAFNSN